MGVWLVTAVSVQDRFLNTNRYLQGVASQQVQVDRAVFGPSQTRNFFQYF